MFVFKATEKTYTDPISATFVPGIPFGREYSKGDVCLLHEELSASKMFFNSKILREAILNSKEYLEEVLEIQIKDAREDLITEEEVKAVAEAIVIKEEKENKEVSEVVADIIAESSDKVTETEEAHEEETDKEPEAPVAEVKPKNTKKK